MPESQLLQTLLVAVENCYGNMREPQYEKLIIYLNGSPYQIVIDALRAAGIAVADATDMNDDVAVHLALDRNGEQVGIVLSGVGPFAALLHQNPDGKYCWIDKLDGAPNNLARQVAEIVQRAGLALLDRTTVVHTIQMTRPDGNETSTRYQALFTDSDVIP